MAAKDDTAQSFDPMQILLSALTKGKGQTETTKSNAASASALNKASASASGVNADAATDDIIQRALQAFAPVLAQQSGAGAYNSAATKLLAGNAAAEATKQAIIAKNQSALDQAKVQAQIAQLMQAGDNTRTVTGAAVDPAKALLAAAGTSILGGIGKKAAEKGGSFLSDIGDKAWDAGASWVDSLIGTDAPTSLDLPSSYADIGASLSAGGAESVVPDFMTQTTDIASGLGDLLPEFDISTALDTGVSSVEDAFNAASDWFTF